MEVIKCKLCMEAFKNELNLILHFKQSHLDSDYSEVDSLGSDSEEESEGEDESEQCEYNEFMSFLTDFEKDLLHSAYSVAEEEGFTVDDLSVPSSFNDKIKDEKGNRQDQLGPNSFITEYEWRLLESSSSRAEAEGIVKVEEESPEGTNHSHNSVSSNKANAGVDQDLASPSSTGIRRKLPVRRCKQAIPEQRSPLEKVRQLLPRLKPTQKEQLESHAETESEEGDGDKKDDHKFKCHHKGCGKSFKRPSHLNRHMESHKIKPHMCATCKQNFAKPHLLEAHMLTHKKGTAPMECEVCHKQFSKLRTLQIHRLVHAKSNPFVCNRCQKGFYKKVHLEKHVKVHKSKPYMCTLCKQNFARPYYLETHMLTHHKEESPKHPLECEYCHKRFLNKKSLQTHIIIHASSNPHVCNQCQRVFARKEHLDEHIMNKHSKGPGVGFQCDLCDQRFGTERSLIRHKKVHNNLCFPCKMCDKRFIRKTHLKLHTLSSHIKLRQGKFGCQKCNKLFLKEDALVAHIILAHKKPDLGSSNDNDDTTDDSSP